MRKLFTLVLVLGAINFYGQETDTEAGNDFNRWSIDINGGVHKPTRPFTPDYFTSTPDLWNADLGVRYMFTDKVGLKLDFGFYNIEGAEESADFRTNYYRTSLQGVVNLGTLLGFREVSNRINFLVHGGAGYSRIHTQEPVEHDFKDQMVNLIAGFTPQIRLSDKVALNGDVSFIGNVRQDYNWDGTDSYVQRGFDGMMVTGSIGLSIYLGANEKHADWYVANVENEKMDSLKRRIEKIENDLLDSDQDGVPDYLDREPNTTSGVAVDSKGYAVDINKNGIPDELEASLDQRYNKKGEIVGDTSETIKKLINDGYVNVYFEFNSDVPATYSLEAINYLIKYLKGNSSANGEIIGYADEIGEPAYNSKLSERRAKRVYDILIAAGIDAGRLSYTGNGEDGTVDKSSKDARQLVRRVTFKIK